MRINWSDGWVSDTSGEYRVEKEPDGWVVLGHGFFCPVDTREEGERLIRDMKGENDDGEQ